jgi:hypothetical protein
MSEEIKPTQDVPVAEAGGEKQKEFYVRDKVTWFGGRTAVLYLQQDGWQWTDWESKAGKWPENVATEFLEKWSKFDRKDEKITYTLVEVRDKTRESLGQSLI